jgi:hypothetical protein
MSLKNKVGMITPELEAEDFLKRTLVTRYSLGTINPRNHITLEWDGA